MKNFWRTQMKNLMSFFIVIFLMLLGWIFSTFSLGALGQGSLPPPVPVAQPSKIDKKIEDNSVQGSLPPPVPVVQPSKINKKINVIEDNSAVMPGKFIKNRLETMSVGGAGYIPVQGLKVDSYRKCWLDPQQTYNKKSERNVVLVTKDDSGFHIVLEEISHQWEAGDFDNKGWLDIKTIRISK